MLAHCFHRIGSWRDRMDYVTEELDGDHQHRFDQRLPAQISGPNSGFVYPLHSTSWITSAVFAVITGVISLAMLVVLLRLMAGSLRRRRDRLDEVPLLDDM